jgi:hypothetical protein
MHTKTTRAKRKRGQLVPAATGRPRGRQLPAARAPSHQSQDSAMPSVVRQGRRVEREQEKKGTRTHAASAREHQSTYRLLRFPGPQSCTWRRRASEHTRKRRPALGGPHKRRRTLAPSLNVWDRDSCSMVSFKARKVASNGTSAPRAGLAGARIRVTTHTRTSLFLNIELPPRFGPPLSPTWPKVPFLVHTFPALRNDGIVTACNALCQSPEGETAPRDYDTPAQSKQHS